MHKNILLSTILFASWAVIASGDKLAFPPNYTWPLNTQKLCFAARFNLTMNVEYTKNDSSTAQATIPLDSSTFQSYSVSCGSPSNVHQLAITIFDGLSALIFTFVVNDSNSVSLTNLRGYLFVNNQQTYITDYSETTGGLHKFASNGSYFTSARDHSYRCDSKTQITDVQTNGTLTIKSIDMENLQVQPFVDDSQDFSQYATATLCKEDKDKDSNVIPIIVGACLAALVVIVLIAYIIGRQRARNGYQTV